MPLSSWQDPAADGAELGWVERTSAALRQPGVGEEAPNAMNHVSRADEERVRRVYGAETYQRLAELKRRHDPENVFHRNFSIVPA